MKTAGMLVCAALAALALYAEDLTTYKRYIADGGGNGRYLVNLATPLGDTAIQTNLTSGMFEYPKYRGTGALWYQINNGDTNDAPMNTAYAADATPGEFFGYRFKKTATVTGLVLQDYSYANDIGGRFAATPQVELLTGGRNGTWTPAAASWSPAYDTNQSDGASAAYTITLTTPAADVWGVRLHGNGQPGPASGDPNGFAACRELQVLGTPNWGEASLAQDLAMSDDKTEVWNWRQFAGSPNALTDGDVGNDFQTSYSDNYKPAPHWFGVEWVDAKSNVTAVGWIMRMFVDGGWFEKDSVKVDVQVYDAGVGDVVWTNLVTGLDASSYNDVIADLVEFRTNTLPNPGNFDTGFLLTFDPISDIYGIRISGDPGGRAGAVTGFVGATCFQVFQKVTSQPPLPPQLSWPPDNAGLGTLQPQFVWQAAQVMDGSNIVSYDLKVGDLEYTGITTTNYTPSAPLVEGSYQWRVRAHDDLGNVSMYSVARTLAVYDPTFAPDLTTYHERGMNGVISRYLVNLGRINGDTARLYTNTSGIYDYPKTRGNQKEWWIMNDGVKEGDKAVTFFHSDNLVETQEFYGYKFKRTATVTGLEVWEYSFGDGGIFQTVPPTVEVLTDGRTGTWQAVAATWAPDYDPSLMNGATRNYTVTLDTPAAGVWGVRLIGDGNPIAADPSGFVACHELRVLGSIDWELDLSRNLAVDGTPILVVTHGTAGALNDNNIGASSAVDTYGGPTNEPHWLGIQWSTPQNDVAAIGWVMRFYADGGWIDPAGLAVEYTTDGGTNWTPVSNLDSGSYAGDVNALIHIRTNHTASSSPQLDTGFLFTFDAVDGINGVRLKGMPGGNAQFMSAIEFEVFGVPEPGIMAGLALAGLALARRRR